MWLLSLYTNKSEIGANSPDYRDTEDIIRFPWFTHTKDFNEVNAYTRLITELANMARNSKHIMAKDKPVGNGNCAFRCFLLRSGLIGDEYKTTRRILFKRIGGNLDWKDKSNIGRDVPI